MAGHSPGLTKSFKAGAAIGRRLIVKFGAADETVLPGAAATDLLLGVTTDIDAALGEPCDVHLGGIAEVIYGGNVTRGQKLTSDANGKAVAAAPAAGVNNQIIGIAMASGVADDIGAVLLDRSVMQGA